MNNLSKTLVIALVVCLLQACKHGIGSNNMAQDTSGTINMMVDGDDSRFAMEAANGNLAEIAMGKLAITRGRSKQIKNFGAMMVKDHTKANNKLTTIAKAKNINLPVAADNIEQQIIAILSKKSGSDFDEAYMNMMIADDEMYVKLFGDESKKLQDPDLKAYAVKAQPILQNHLDAIDAIHDSMANK